MQKGYLVGVRLPVGSASLASRSQVVTQRLLDNRQSITLAVVLILHHHRRGNRLLAGRISFSATDGRALTLSPSGEVRRELPQVRGTAAGESAAESQARDSIVQGTPLHWVVGNGGLSRQIFCEDGHP